MPHGVIRMENKKIYISDDKYSEFLDKIRDFSERRHYILKGKKGSDKDIFVIYDREVVSGVLVGMIDTFMGRYLLPQRIRLTIEIMKKEKKIEVNLRGDVMMIDWDIVDDRPTKRNVMRCNFLLDELIYEINNLLYKS
jgi:hypothetical protein